jgi:hypothetical protein
MIAEVDKALETKNGQIIGVNGEVPIRTFLSRYLPNALKVATGKVRSPKGTLSPQIDVKILDSRYPLLSHHSDGTVIAMLHSVVAAIEVKTSLTKKNLLTIRANTQKICELNGELFPTYVWGGILQQAIAYASPLRDETIADHFMDSCPYPMSDVTVLRSRKFSEVGLKLHWEPDYARRRKKDVAPKDWDAWLGTHTHHSLIFTTTCCRIVFIP